MKVVNGIQTPEVGDTATLTSGRWTDIVTVLAVLSGGKVDVEFQSGARLRCLMLHLGYHRPHTSYAVNGHDVPVTAAHSQSAVLTDAQRKVLAALVFAGVRGLIDHEHYAINGIGQDVVVKRRDELERLGLARTTSRKRSSPRRRPASVREATPAGIAVVNAARARGEAWACTSKQRDTA